MGDAGDWEFAGWVVDFIDSDWGEADGCGNWTGHVSHGAECRDL